MANFNQVLENAVSKAKEFIDAASDKISGVIDEQKLRVKITTERSKVKKEYQKLGEAYYDSLKKGSVFVADEDTIASIDEKNITISELERALAEATGNVVCPECEEFNTKDSEFCKKCGFKLKQD